MLHSLTLLMQYVPIEGLHQRQEDLKGEDLSHILAIDRVLNQHVRVVVVPPQLVNSDLAPLSHHESTVQGNVLLEELCLDHLDGVELLVLLEGEVDLLLALRCFVAHALQAEGQLLHGLDQEAVELLEHAVFVFELVVLVYDGIRQNMDTVRVL